jgi:subtilase family serine protease
MRRQVVVFAIVVSLAGVFSSLASNGQKPSQKEAPSQSPRQPRARPNALPDLLAQVSCSTKDGANPRQILEVVIRNVGTALAGASITKVEFTSGSGPGVFELKTPALWPGHSYKHEVNIPSGCFDPDCGFWITVDPGNYVLESNEANNRFHQNCLG